MSAAVTVRDLRKTYGDLAAVDGVSFEIAEGEVYALLGHNGAGKSTTVEILEGHRTRTSGEVSVLGMDPGNADREFFDRIGIVLQTAGVETEFTVREAIELYGSVYRRRRDTAEVLDLVGLDAKADARIGTLSGGQKRRVDLALGIVGHPDLVFLDEPTTGFDPAARRKSWDLIRGLCELGTTVLLTTHYLDEAEHLAGRVGVLARGRLVAEGTPDELISGLADTIVSCSVPFDRVAAVAEFLPPGARIDGDAVEFVSADPTVDLHRLTTWALDNDVELRGLLVQRPSLEDVFLGLAGEHD